MSIGRSESVQDIILDFSLPISASFSEATRLDLVNPSAVRISRATLILSPFYVFDYMVDAKKRAFRSSLRIGGTKILDALMGEILLKQKTWITRKIIHHILSFQKVTHILRIQKSC
jgi:hypothetical protein